MERAEAGIRDLKAHLSAYLRRVEAGETITITRRGEPIGRLVPASAEKPSMNEKMKVLQKAGILKWSGERLPSLEPLADVKGDRSVSDLLLEDRR